MVIAILGNNFAIYYEVKYTFTMWPRNPVPIIVTKTWMQMFIKSLLLIEKNSMSINW